MIIFRYLGKEVLHTLAAVTLILLFIFSCNEFVRYLSYVASGKYAAWVLIEIVLLQIPVLLGLLLPLGLFLGVLLGYGRLCAESEMTVLFSCGFSDKQLLKATLAFAGAVLVVVTVLSVWVQPIMKLRSHEVLDMAKSGSITQTILPGRFQTTNNGKRVYYIQSLSHDRTKMKHIFVAQQVKAQGSKAKDQKHLWEVLTAATGHQKTQHSGDKYVVMQNGQLYKGSPGQNAYKIAKFDRYGVRTTVGSINTVKDIDSISTAQLLPLAFKNKEVAAELQWRIAAPLSVLVLVLIALPLSQLKPRQGRFARILPAIILYIIYANLIFLARAWTSSGAIPPWLGIWWVHGIFFIVGLVLMQRQFSWRVKKRLRD